MSSEQNGQRARYENIPAELKVLHQWDTYKLEQRGDKITKVPYDPRTGQRASSTDEHTWCSYDEAVTAVEAGGYDGIVFVFKKDGGYMGIDLDRCRDPISGVMDDWAQDIVDHISTYTEASVSGLGVHLIVRGNVPGPRRRSGQIEMYDQARYFCMSGNQLPGTPSDILDCQINVQALYDATFAKVGEHPGTGGTLDPVDQELLDRAMQAPGSRAARLRHLFDGRWREAGYPSQSEADAAFLVELNYLTGGDKERCFRIFEASGLMRDKWKRADYRARTWEYVSQSQTANNTEFVPDYAKEVLVKAQQTDVGNARRLAVVHGHKYRYLSARKKWATWDGSRWVDDEVGGVVEAAKQIVAMIRDCARRLMSGESLPGIQVQEPDKLGLSLFGFASQSEGARNLAAMIKLAQSDPRVSITVRDMDADRMLFNVKNGTIDLSTGKIRPHNRDDLITKLAPVNYDPEAKCPRWEKFLLDITAGKVELVGYLQRSLGYCLTGETKEQVVQFLIGPGGNGKSTLIEVVMAVMGDYAQKAPRSLIQRPRHGEASIPADMARLQGVRMAVCSELEEGEPLAESKVKDLTGGDSITARYLYENFIEFDPTHKLIAIGNSRPVVTENSDGIWRRIQLLLLTKVFTGDSRDRDIKERLLAELSGILNWLIEGCLLWQQHGLNPPKFVLDATAEYRADADGLGQYLADRCIVDPKGRVTSSSLYADHKVWSEREGEPLLSRQRFAHRLRQRNFRAGKQDGVRCWFGLTLIDLTPPRGY